MGVMVHRYRPNGTSIGTLDLEEAAAANRRFETAAATLPKNHALKALRWVKSSTAATDIQIYQIDRANADQAFLLEERLGDTNTHGSWTPPDGEVLGGYDIHNPADDSQRLDYRIQFGQAGAACTANVIATYKEV